MRFTTIEMLEKLVAFDTVSRTSNLELIDFVANYLSDLGITAEIDYKGDRTCANLYATIGPEDVGGVALSGHTDVVPVEGQPWSTDPFRLYAQGERLHARGAVDMKGFIAGALALLPELLEQKQLTTPIHLSLSYDEEVGCIGVRSLIEKLAARQVRPTSVIVGEPTSMEVVSAHKGKASYRCHVRGREGHSALTDCGVNAIENAAEVITFLKRLSEEIRDGDAHDPGFSPPYTTVHTGLIHGGTQLNIIPRDCYFDFEYRCLPGEDAGLLLDRTKAFAAKLEQQMQSVAADTGFTWEEISNIPGFEAGPEALTLVEQILDARIDAAQMDETQLDETQMDEAQMDETQSDTANSSDGVGPRAKPRSDGVSRRAEPRADSASRQPNPSADSVSRRAQFKVSYGTEAGLFQQAGMPAVVCGPGSITQAHKPDEYLELGQVHALESFLRSLFVKCV